MPLIITQYNSLGDILDLPKYREKIGFVRFYALVLFVLGITFYGGFEFANLHKNNLLSENKLLNKSLNNLTKVNEKLQSQNNVLKVELEIATLSNDKSQETIKQSVNREQALKEQVGFYQRVMAPEMSQDGFVLERMEITPTISERNYALKMILLQHENIKAVVKGKLDIKVFGSENGKPKNFNMNSLQDAAAPPLDFAFKYFQVIESSLTLPEGFIPNRFEIKAAVYKYNKKRGDYSTIIKWEDAFAELE
jgi:hypothetical protein